MTASASALDSASQDARELRQGVAVTYLGYALKLGFPLLVALATRAYGAGEWGRFLSAQALVLVGARICLAGLDKALLWAIPIRSPHEVLPEVRAALFRVGLHALCLSTLTYVGLAAFGAHGADVATLRICSWALTPFVLTELLLNATMGLRRMEIQVAVRETLTPLAHVGVALALHRLGGARHGLAWGFVAAQFLGLFVSWWGFGRLFSVSLFSGPPTFQVSEPLRRYARPMWLSEIANSLLLRLDTVVLTALASPAQVGIWGVVSQFANALRQMRRAYDPIVTALTARIALRRDASRLAETFSYAAQMVSLTQLPVFVTIACLASSILPLFGPGFAQGDAALTLLTGFLLLGGSAGLAGVVVSGYGKSSWVLFNTLLTLVLELGLLLALVPALGLTGAALSVGSAVCLVNVVQLYQMKRVTGSFNLTRRSRYTAGVVFASLAAALVALGVSHLLGPGPVFTRLMCGLAFALVYLPLCWLGYRRGTLRAPR